MSRAVSQVKTCYYGSQQECKAELAYFPRAPHYIPARRVDAATSSPRRGEQLYAQPTNMRVESKKA